MPSCSISYNNIFIVIYLLFLLLFFVQCNTSKKCSSLNKGQYLCSEPIIDSVHQSAKNCDQITRTVKVLCYPIRGIICDSMEFNGSTPAFHKEINCKWTNGKRFDTTLLFSIFLGMLGIDRFYLGYTAIGILKLCTLGLMFVGHFIDVILIALQIIKPADGSDYIIDFYGPVVNGLYYDNSTYVVKHNS